MADCKECIHYNVCVIRTYPNIFEGTQWDKKPCNYFVNAADVAPRAEVVREIFEEIEKIIEKHHSECYEYEDGDECDTAITYISYLSVDIDELKKKYTEGEK